MQRYDNWFRFCELLVKTSAEVFILPEELHKIFLYWKHFWLLRLRVVCHDCLSVIQFDGLRLTVSKVLCNFLPPRMLTKFLTAIIQFELSSTLFFPIQVNCIFLENVRNGSDNWTSFNSHNQKPPCVRNWKANGIVWMEQNCKLSLQCYI